MSRVIRALLLCAYITLIFQYIRSLLISKTREEVLELEYLLKPPALMKKIQREMMKRKNKNVSIHLNIPERLPTDFKYILKYTNAFAHKSSNSRSGQEEFIAEKCKYINCYLTNDKQLLFDLQYYDAILFDIENVWDDYPSFRSPHQRYIFVASESAADNPICNKYLESFYNLTWTYKLNSDITWSYFTIFDKNGEVVGPKVDMKWKDVMDAPSNEVKKKLEKKTKVAAWFVSNCETKSKRQAIYEHLELEFLKRNMTIDVYGWCGKKVCSKERMEDCLDLVDKDYYFYLAFENSVSEDYVTDKVLNALLHHAVPIVYGGANYSRFLPPGSYINAYTEHPEKVAALVYEATQNRKVYENYFRWHNHYVYKATGNIGDVCTLCEVMNTPMSNRTVMNFRKWWNPNYTTFKADCKY